MDEIKAVLDVVIPVTIYVRKGDREGPLLRQGLLEFSAHKVQCALIDPKPELGEVIHYRFVQIFKISVIPISPKSLRLA